jgi:hypothetical protein
VEKEKAQKQSSKLEAIVEWGSVENIIKSAWTLQQVSLGKGIRCVASVAKIPS